MGTINTQTMKSKVSSSGKTSGTPTKKKKKAMKNVKSTTAIATSSSGGTGGKSNTTSGSREATNSTAKSLSSGGGGAGASNADSGSVASAKSGHDSSSAAAGTPTGFTICTPEQQELLKQCDWNDKLLWSTRLLLGGHSVNGFLRATAAAQRIKKQRARQTASTKKSQEKAAAIAAGLPPSGTATMTDPGTATGTGDPSKSVHNTAAAPGDPVPSTSKNSSVGGFDPEEEEQIKKDIMNPRTAKKIRSELESGLIFCAHLHNVMRTLIADIEPSLRSTLPPALSLGDSGFNGKKKEYTFLTRPPGFVPPKERLSPVKSPSSRPGATASKKPTSAAAASTNIFATNTNDKVSSIKSAGPGSSPSKKDSAKSSGTHHSSSLRRNRKKKLPPNPEAHILTRDLPEFDVNGRRTCSKKDYSSRVFQLLRFRPLKVGDFCAARTSSRDLWILAKVLKDYPTGYSQLAGTPLEFLQLSDTRRDALFRDNNVLLKDVEETNEGTGTTNVARNLVLPLPRNFSEAADWASRLKKGSRVYGMYPHTTSLYPATVVDATTYCRGDDDIIVVEFDGEEADSSTGVIPTYHIPARFVTLIPKEFPASEKPSTTPNATSGGKSTTTTTTSGLKRKAISLSSKQQRKSSSGPSPRKKDSGLDLMNMDMGGGLSFDQLDLDFDKPLEGQDVEDVSDTFMF